MTCLFPAAIPTRRRRFVASRSVDLNRYLFVTSARPVGLNRRCRRLVAVVRPVDLGVRLLVDGDRSVDLVVLVVGGNGSVARLDDGYVVVCNRLLQATTV